MKWPYNIKFNSKFNYVMDEKSSLMSSVKKSSHWFEFHGELYLFGVKVWDFRIPPQDSSNSEKV